MADSDGIQLPASLDEAKVSSLPDHAYYIPNFISEQEEEEILRKILSTPLPRWTHLSHRRLQTHPTALTQSNVLLSSPLSPWLTTPIIPRFTSLRIFEKSPHNVPNHVLINEYEPGQGIMPHEDGAAYWGCVATVSLGASIVLDIYGKDRNEAKDGDEHVADEHGEKSKRTKEPVYRILQEPRSLLVTTGKMYTDYLHGIAEHEIDADLREGSITNWDLLGDKDAFASGTYQRETRLSLTYRDVLKVSKLGNTLKFLGRK